MIAIIRFNDPRGIAILLIEKLEIHLMTEKSYPFSNLTDAQRAAILARARAERAAAMAAAFRGAMHFLAQLANGRSRAAKGDVIPAAASRRAIR